ncbi:hypothetical protein [Streptomyces sp. NPDC021020]|uniref:hypothetical protein n=1 Tax=Streptomyces sp. NPDC021020 TaxID=3365109 RepID=UPI0037B75628
MVTSKHEASHRIFQDRPEVMDSVFRLLGMRLPEQVVVEVLTPDVTENRPVERRVDSVLRISSGNDSMDTFLLAIEAQMRRDDGKAVSWAYYLSYLKAKYGCPALLLVVCQDKVTADWAVGPFQLGPESWCALTVHPLVVGPGNIPVVLNVDEAAGNLAMAALSAMTHSKHQDIAAILESLAGALEGLDKETVDYYSDMLEIGLGDPRAQEVWRKLMGSTIFFPGRGTFREQLLLEGKAEGLKEGRKDALAHVAHNVLTVFRHRGLAAPDSVRERVLGCDDFELLDRWHERALSVEVADDIFAVDD